MHSAGSKGILMPKQAAKRSRTQIGAGERRTRLRQTMVLRVGILTSAGRSTFCLVRNISPQGVQVRLFGVLAEGSEVHLRLGDEDSLAGRLVWIRDGLAGIEFDEPLDPLTMLRAMQKLAPARRRSASVAPDLSSASERVSETVSTAILSGMKGRD